MKPVSDSTALVIDHCLFFPLAQRLAEDGGFKRVLYHVPCSEAFPKVEKAIIGDGFDRVEKCEDIWSANADVWIFPDIYDAPLQGHLRDMGMAVWGSGNSDSLEINRDKFIRTLIDVGLTVPKYQRVVGLTNLREHLRDREDKYIKISKFRGTLETTHWRSWSEDESLLDSLALKLGPTKDLLPFLVFDAIETDLEIGADTYCIDGDFPKTMLNGLEWKDKGYLGAVTERIEMPEHIREVIYAFAPILKREQHRNFLSMEVRVQGDTGYFIDPTCRMPCPGSGSQLKLIKNLPEIINAGAHGELIEPQWNGKVSAECVISQKKGRDLWSIADFPDALRPHLFCGNSCEIDGRICSPPCDDDEHTVGWLVAIGDTIEEVVDTMKEYTEMLPDGIHANTDSLFDLIKETHSAEKEGIEFTDKPLPEPEIAIDSA